MSLDNMNEDTSRLVAAAENMRTARTAVAQQRQAVAEAQRELDRLEAEWRTASETFERLARS